MEYIPGTCNIGPQEIARRYRLGYFGIALAIFVVVFIGVAGLPREARLLLAVPVALALAGFIQAYRRFCLAYGLRGVFSIQGLKKFHRVRSSDARKADLKTATWIIVVVVTGAIATALLYYAIP